MQAEADNAAEARRTGGGRGALWTVVLVAVLLRLVMVLAPPADTYPMGDGKRVAGEELLRGSATKDFLEGTVLPAFQDYQVQPFWGGSLVVSVMAVPFFAVFGPTIVALRLTAVVFAALGAGAVFWILDRFASRRAAWIGGLFQALAPPGYAVFGATAYGAEVENNTMAVLTVAAFLAYLYGRRTPLRGMLAGALAGFSIYCGYIVLPLIALLVLFWFWLDKRFLLRRSVVWPIAGFLVGLYPSIHYNLTHSFGGLEVYGEELTGHLAPSAFAGRLLHSTVELFWRDLPGAFYFQEPLRFPLGRVLTLVFLGLAAVVAVQHRDSIRRALRAPWHASVEPRSVDPAVLLLAFLPTYALAYLMTDFRVDHERGLAIAYRYLLPFFPFLFMLGAIGLDALSQRSAAVRRAAYAVTAGICTVFLASNLAYCNFDRVRDNWNRPGYSDREFARAIMLRYRGDTEALAYIVDKVAQKRPADVQDKLFFVVAQTYKFHLHPNSELDAFWNEQRDELERALAFLHEQVPEDYRAYFEPLAPRERIYKHREKDQWRRDRERRGQ